MSAQEKAVGVLDTPSTALTKSNTATLSPADALGKPYATLQAQFALLGHSLQHTRRADDGKITYVVSRWNQARFFSHLNDVRAFLTQIGGCNG